VRRLGGQPLTNNQRPSHCAPENHRRPAVVRGWVAARKAVAALGSTGRWGAGVGAP